MSDPVAVALRSHNSGLPRVADTRLSIVATAVAELMRVDRLVESDGTTMASSVVKTFGGEVKASAPGMFHDLLPRDPERSSPANGALG